MLFGLAAGVSPGPLLALVVSETVRHSRRQGMLVASAPLVTDAPIVAVSLLVLAQLRRSELILGIIAGLGALYVGYLAFENVGTRSVRLEVSRKTPHSLRKGVVTNLLSPHPYLFWITIGAPMVLDAAGESGPLGSVLYLVGFYVGLVGSKMGIALVVERSKRFLGSGAYLWILRALGLALAVFAVLFAREALRYFGVL
jgi:threonine/homoserine/homoserine lactone efflux protein